MTCKYSPSGKHVAGQGSGGRNPAVCQYCEEYFSTDQPLPAPTQLPPRPRVQGGDYRPHYAARPAGEYMDALESRIEREYTLVEQTKSERDVLQADNRNLTKQWQELRIELAVALARCEELETRVNTLQILVDSADESDGSLMWTSDHNKILARELAALRNHTPLVGQDFDAWFDNYCPRPEESPANHQSIYADLIRDWRMKKVAARAAWLASGASPAWRDCEQELPQCTNGMFLVTYLFQDKHPCQRVCAWYNGAFHDLELKVLNVTHWKPLDSYPPAPASGGQQ